MRRRFVVGLDELRFGLTSSLELATGWMVAIGGILLALPTRRFDTPAWSFINQIPGADNTVGAVYLVLGVAMSAALYLGRQRCMAIMLGLAGMANWSLGVFLLVGTPQGSSGGIGFALALYLGGHMLSTSVTLWHRHLQGS